MGLKTMSGTDNILYCTYYPSSSDSIREVRLCLFLCEDLSLFQLGLCAKDGVRGQSLSLE